MLYVDISVVSSNVQTSRRRRKDISDNSRAPGAGAVVTAGAEEMMAPYEEGLVLLAPLVVDAPGGVIENTS